MKTSQEIMNEIEELKKIKNPTHLTFRLWEKGQAQKSERLECYKKFVDYLKGLEENGRLDERIRLKISQLQQEIEILEKI
jgi:hypothetical protein